jgi:hypothetical protein
MTHEFDFRCNLLRNVNPQLMVSVAGWVETAVKKMRESSGTENCRQVWRRHFGLD